MDETALDDVVVTSDHEAIREWATTAGGRPVVEQGASGPGRVGIAFGDGETTGHGRVPVGWEAFFAALDDEGLALAFEPADGEDGEAPRYAVLDAEDRIDDEAVEEVWEERRRERRESAAEHDVEERSTRRVGEARDQENVDNHRDEPPFRS